MPNMTKQIKLSEEYLLEQYVKNKKGIAWICRDTGVCERTVQNCLDFFKIKKQKVRTLEDLTGKVFRNWTVLKYDCPYLNSHKWICQCKCGKIKSIFVSSLRSKDSTQCKECYLLKSTSPEKIKNRIWKVMLRCADVRNIKVEVDVDYIWDLYWNQDRKCALTGIDISLDRRKNKYNQTASLDRIDSSVGYIKGNVQWVHKTVNKIKVNLKEEEFFKWCKLVINGPKCTKMVERKSEQSNETQRRPGC